MSTSQKPKKPSKQLIKPNLPSSCSAKDDPENSSQPPRKRSNHGKSSQPSKKFKTKSGGEVLKPLTSVVNGGGSRSNSQTNGTMTVAGKATGESIQLTNYMSTLIHAAPVPLPQKNQLNEAEMSFLKDVSKGSSQKDNELVLDDNDNESVENGEENREDNNEEDEDNIMVEDVNLPNSQRSKSGKDRVLSSKVLLSEFANPKLARLAKCCARMATCTVNMCPEDPLFSWPTFTNKIERLVKEGRGSDLVESLKIVNDDPERKDKLVKFTLGEKLISTLPNTLTSLGCKVPKKLYLWSHGFSKTGITTILEWT
ncbi:hypothetical protein BT96DRAFT_941261 [Gymnopus androsaceus JB14]|uniref:Uncharacterized protein n=1 Tax=Gymnopus androsaceus JB14 TaxID=1447944 RepID=A0A6A4HHI2_9AGAR|nr:hypothetical protein BT96DRAFT_941261 [Gymnopus androsaceus JB14]